MDRLEILRGPQSPRLKIGILSDCRVPTRHDGGHGLGRVAYDISHFMERHGHAVYLYAGYGSQYKAGHLIMHSDENVRAWSFAESNPVACDVYLDLSHTHELGRANPDLRVVSYVMDLEAPRDIRNCLVGGPYMESLHPGARLCPLGIDIQGIPFTPRAADPARLLFASRLHPAKGHDTAMSAAARVGMPLDMIGQNHVQMTEFPPHVNYMGTLNDNAALYALVGRSYALLSPARQDAGGRINLEAAACGCPVLTLEGTGTTDHVAHGVSGWICADERELADAVQDAALIDRTAARAWVSETHGMSQMMMTIEQALFAVMDGERW